MEPALDDYTLLALPLIAFVAFFLKAMTGFGPAIVVIAFGSLLLPPQAVIATSSVLDFMAGAVLFHGSGARSKPRFLVVLTGAMVVGTLIGAAALSSIPSDRFRPIFGFAILTLAVWFTFFRARGGAQNLHSELPDRCDREDIVYSTFAGFLGGLFGISGPPILWHLGRRYRKETFRSILITIFVVAAFARVVSFSIGGLIDRKVLYYIALCLPGQIAGLYFGSRAFMGISERRFSVIAGLILLAISVKLLI